MNDEKNNYTENNQDVKELDKTLETVKIDEMSKANEITKVNENYSFEEKSFEEQTIIKPKPSSKANIIKGFAAATVAVVSVVAISVSGHTYSVNLNEEEIGANYAFFDVDYDRYGSFNIIVEVLSQEQNYSKTLKAEDFTVYFDCLFADTDYKMTIKEEKKNNIVFEKDFKTKSLNDEIKVNYEIESNETIIKIEGKSLDSYESFYYEITSNETDTKRYEITDIKEGIRIINNSMTQVNSNLCIYGNFKNNKGTDILIKKIIINI